MTFDCEYLGAGPETLTELVEGRHPFASVLKAAKRPMLVLGMGALARPDGAAILAAARRLAEETGMISDGDGEAQEPWNGFNVLHSAAARVAGLDMGFVPGTGGKDIAGILADAQAGTIKAVYLLAADELDVAALRDCFVIYQGHHGDAGAHAADVILPGAAYTEKGGLYVNTEGRVQVGRRAVFPPGDAREDWKILRALSARLDHTLPFDDVTGLRQKLVEAHPVFAGMDTPEPAKWSKFGRAGKLSGDAFGAAVDNFYMTCPISRASQTMAECTEEFVNRAPAKTGTAG